MLGADQALAEIRRLYFSATRDTIHDDLAKALDLLRSMPNEEARERATVYMHGLNEMRAQWKAKKGGKGPGTPKRAGPPDRAREGGRRGR